MADILSLGRDQCEPHIARYICRAQGHGFYLGNTSRKIDVMQLTTCKTTSSTLSALFSSFYGNWLQEGPPLSELLTRGSKGVG